LLQLRVMPQGQYFASVDASLRGSRCRNLLAAICRDRGRLTEAELEWRATLAERPEAEACVGLGELLLQQGRWGELDEVAEQLRHSGTGPDATILRARGLIAREEFIPARRVLVEASASFPHALGPRVILSHALIRCEAWDAAERALRDILAIDPHHGEARHNLEVLLRQQVRG
jgi:Flp pilus assembly protein TadD